MYHSSILRSFFTVLLVACSLVSFAQTSKTDSLKNRLQSAVGKDRYDLLFGIAYELFDVDNQEAVKYATDANLLAQELGDSLAITRSGRIRGQLLRRVDNTLESITQLEYILPIAKRNSYLSEEKIILNALAVSYTFIANYDKALEYNFQSLEIREREGDKKAISMALNNIGLVYYKLSNFEQSLDFYTRALNAKQEVNDSFDLEILLINIGLCYNKMSDHERAQEFVNQAFKICGEKCDSQIRMQGEFVLGLSSFEFEEYSKSLIHFNTALDLSKEMGDRRFEAEISHYQGKLKMIDKDFPSAVDWMKRAIELSKSSGYNGILISSFLELSKLYNETSNFQQASYYQNEYIHLKDSIYSGELIKNLAKIQANYEERVNLQTIRERDENIKLQNELIARQRLQYIFIVLVSILVVLLATVLIWANRRQHRHNAALSEAKRVIEDQNKELTKSNEELDRRVQQKTRDLFLTNESLTQVNEELDNFIYRTSHDIRGPLVTLKGVCNVALLDVKDTLAIDYLNRLDLTAEKLNSILTRLLIVNQINHSDLEASTIDFKEMIDNILVSERKNGLPSNLSIEYQIDPSVKLISDHALIRIVLENLIDNSIKFYNTSERIKPYVKIKVDRGNADKIRIRVEDNGIGINPRDKDQIFHLFVRASERSETGGIGLYLSKLSTHRLGGEIILADTSERGTTFMVLIPADLRPILEKRREEEELRKKDKALREKEMQAREKAGDYEAVIGISSKQNNLLTS